MVMSGGVGRHPPAEAEVMLQLAIASGIPAEAMLVEKRSRNTFENALHCRAVFKRMGWRSAVVVTDRFHCLRAKLIFSACGLTVQMSPCPPSGAAPLRWALACREVPALVKYLWLAARVWARSS